MTRAELLKLMDETREIIEQMPEELPVDYVLFHAFRPSECLLHEPTVFIELNSECWDAIKQEAADWGEELAEEIDESEPNLLLLRMNTRYFELNTHNERVCVYRMRFTEADNGE